MLKDLVKAEKGSGEPNKNKIGKVTMAQCRDLAKEKGKDIKRLRFRPRRPRHRRHGPFDGDHRRRLIGHESGSDQEASRRAAV
jgi:hypothetical protein